MLKTVEAVLAMLKEQEEALGMTIAERIERDAAMVKVIQEDGTEVQEQLSTMRSNVRLAIRKIEGTTEEVNHG